VDFRGGSDVQDEYTVDIEEKRAVSISEGLERSSSWSFVEIVNGITRMSSNVVEFWTAVKDLAEEVAVDQHS